MISSAASRNLPVRYCVVHTVTHRLFTAAQKTGQAGQTEQPNPIPISVLIIHAAPAATQ
jgi:hypothetical protein